jgi:hypothetical protein
VTPRQMVFVTFVALALFVLVLELIRRHMLREKYSMVWFLTCIVFLTVPLLYDVYAWFASWVGILDPISLFFYLAIVGLVLLSLQFSLALSTAFYQRKALTQSMALLEQRLRRLEARRREEPPTPGQGGRPGATDEPTTPAAQGDE